MVLIGWLVLVCLQTSAAGQSAFERVREQARRMADQPFHEPASRVPQALLDLSYVQYQAIQFRQEKALWAAEGLPFHLEFFLPGSVHKHTVAIHEWTDRGPRRIPFSRDSFSLGTNQVEIPPDLGYAGFRILYPGGQFGETGSFVGASYFRMIGRGQAFGASARGLALNTSLQGQEEFPAFREFWIRRPEKGDQSLACAALLDSPSVAGAFDFVITPGVNTLTRVRAVFFPRREIKVFGLAPLTSMFLHDENSRRAYTDYRSEVHDSDGLLLETGPGEILWRPLDSGKMIRVNAYQDTDPKGFGLMQRNRDFERYQDLIARFELRPSVWIRPLGKWGAGSVQLVQLPSDLEYTDNVVAYWVPATPPAPGQPLELSYDIHWQKSSVLSPKLGHVLATRIGRVGTGAPSANLRFVIDFAGPAVEALPAAERLQAEIRCGEGATFVADTIVKNEINHTWRLVVEITSPSQAVDLRARLTRRGQPITETWVYTWQP